VLHGQISASDYSLSQPAVLVESGSQLSYVAAVSATGSFTISVPAGQSYRLTLTDRTPTGTLALVSRILWSAGGQDFVWAKIGSGAAINLGLIRPLSATEVATSQPLHGLSESQGENDDDQCDEDDDAQGDEQGPSGKGGTCQPKVQAPVHPSLCVSPKHVDSKGDRDEKEGCDKDGKDHGDDDRDDDHGFARVCSDGGVKMSSGELKSEDDEGDDDGSRSCVKHVPKCPLQSAGSGAPPAGPPSGGTPPPAPDMGSSGTIP
jgi:hypothetical protein